MSHKPWWRREDGQSLIELFIIFPIYVLMAILVVQLTATFFGVFGDLSEVRNTALKAGRKAETLRAACFEERDTHSFLLGISGSSERYETRVRAYAFGAGPANCPG
jgi:hypothetical protein